MAPIRSSLLSLLFIHTIPLTATLLFPASLHCSSRAYLERGTYLDHMEGKGSSTSFRTAAALLALLALGLQAGTCAAVRAAPVHHDDHTAAAEFIRTRCNATKYPHLCVRSLSAFAGTIRTSPTQLADAALSVTLTHAQSTSALVARLSAGRRGMEPRVASAVGDCMETMGDSVDELRESLREMARLGQRKKGGKKANLRLLVGDIQTWVSAALTDEDTCMDEFAGRAMDGEVKAAVRGHIAKVARLTSNALALINGLSSIASP